MNKLLQLLIVSFVTAIIYCLLISFDAGQPDTPIRFSVWENFFLIPLLFTVMFIPYVFFYGSVTFSLKFFIEKAAGLKSVVFDILFYGSIAILVIPVLPHMIKGAAHSTAYPFFVNPYYLIPLAGSMILLLFELYNKKRAELCDRRSKVAL